MPDTVLVGERSVGLPHPHRRRMHLVSACLLVLCTGIYGATLPTETCDVLVVGGGPAGIAAAGQAARAGAKTVLLEQGFQVGGNMTSGSVNWPGLFHAYGELVIAGFGWETVSNMIVVP